MEKLARKRGWLKTQPVADAIAELPRAPAQRIETFQPDEVAALLGKAGERRHQMNARPTAAMNVVVHLAALCGLRMGEILGLPVDAIDLDRRRLEVRQAVSRFYDIKGPKTAAGFRTVPLPAPVVTVLRHWLEHHHIANAAGLLLTSPNGLVIRQGNLRVQWNTLLDVTALPRRHFHALRHFYASWHIANGTPAPDVAKLLGHAQFDMTLRVYTHALMRDDARVAQADRIAGLLIPADARAPQMALTH